MKPNHYIGEVVEDEDGELCVELPVEMLQQMGWDEGTLLEWLTDEENNVTIREKECQQQQESETM
jgi:hypothetical protein